ncbi:MAG: N-acyl homoserine lactonase family protein [Nitrososphaerota archaeon]
MGVKNIYLLDFGILSGELGWFLPDPAGWTETVVEKKPKIPVWTDIPVTGAVIEHTDGRVLIDSGSHPEAKKVWGPVWEVFPMTKFTDENRLENQLKLINLKPEDIDYVVFTHLHLDHAGQAYLFKDLKKPLIAHKKELMWAVYLLYLGKAGAYQPVDLEALKGGEWFTFEGETFELLPGIELMFVGGHTPGSIIIKVETEAGNNYIFTGDFIHLPEELERESKGWLLGDVDEYITGLRKIKLLAKRPRTNLVISHDPKLWEKYPKAPKALR